MNETVSRLPDDVTEAVSSVLETYGIRYGGGSIKNGVLQMTVNTKAEDTYNLERVARLVMSMFCVSNLKLNGIDFSAT